MGATIFLGASCAGEPDDTAAPPAPEKHEAKAKAPEHATKTPLDRAFPAQADRVLGRKRSLGFVAADVGFTRAPTNSLGRFVDVQLPKDGAGEVKVIAPGGLEIQVKEMDAEGPGAFAERAVTYRRAGGTSYWTVTDGGAEEWLHLAAGTVESMDDVAASWEVHGAKLVAMNGAVALMDEQGVARAWVTAPEAFGADGRSVEIRLETHDDRIELFADARGEEVLIDPGWVAVAPSATGRYAGALTVLASGKALLTGGFTGVTIPNAAEQYDPTTNTWTAAGTMTAGRYLAANVLLGNGRVLVAGGQTLVGYPTAAEQYNPATNTWSSAGTMASSRGTDMAVLLANGKVLVAGGYNGATFVATSELYDPTTNTWAAAAPMATARGIATITRLANGKVLVAGGGNGAINAPTPLQSAEIYDPVANTWASAGNMAAARYFAQATLLTNGKVLVAGGLAAAGSLTGAELYDPVTNTWSAAAPMSKSRAAFNGISLGSGQFLSAGGITGPNGAQAAEASSEVYDPLANTWTSAGNMNSARYLAASATLAGGDALVVGGSPDGATALTSADRYYYSSQAAGTSCSLAVQCASGFCVNGVCCQVAACTGDQCHNAGTCQAGTGVCSTPNKANGTACNDASACTSADACQNGVCMGTNSVTCTAQDQCHVAGTCDPVTGMCSNPNQADGTACNDMNDCTQTDTCQAGTCTGANPVVCTAMDQCHDVGTCDPSTGTCSSPNKTDGTPCNDANACTGADSCVAGVCTGANPVVCTPLDQCHEAGACDTMTGVCSNPNKSDGAACDDGDACTQTDTCTAGACGGANPVVCAAMDQCHDAGTCDSKTGMCSNPTKADGATCDDGDACTQTDTCTAGACGGANPVTCTAMDDCHDAGKCDSATGMCSNPNKPDGTVCATGTCESGTCVDNTTGTGGTGGSGTGGSATGGSATGGSATGGSGTGASATGGTDTGGVGASGGCGCRVAGEDSGDTAPASAFAGLALAALAWSRRRRTAKA